LIKKLLKSLREYKKEAILTPLLMVLEVAMEVSLPLIIVQFGKAIDKLQANKMLIWGGIMVLCSVIALVAGMLGGKFAAKASTGFAKNLRQDMFDKVQDFSFSNIDKFSSSSLVTRITTDVTNVQMAFMMVIRIAVRSPLMFIFSIVGSFLISPTLPVIFFVTIPILGFGLFMVIRKAMPIFRKVFKKYDNLNESIQENIKGMRVVKAYVREDYETKKFTAVSNELCGDFTRAEKILAFNAPLMQMCLQGALIAIAFFGSRIIIKTPLGSLQPWGLQSLLTYSLQILVALQMVSMIFVMLTLSAESGRRIVEVLDEQSSIVNPKNPVNEVISGDIEFSNVNFRYSSQAEKFALYDIDLKIKSGETIGVIGGTGSGKSTLLSLLYRGYLFNDGEVKIDGKSLLNYTDSELREKVAVVPQKAVLFDGTIRENLSWGKKDATDEELLYAVEMANASEVLAKCGGLDATIEEGGKNLSGGQRQRLTIARALVKNNAEVLIFDDSFSALDFATEAKLLKNLNNYAQTKIIVSQRISSIRNADKILVLEKGKIDALGSLEQVLENSEIFREIYNSQVKEGV